MSGGTFYCLGYLGEFELFVDSVGLNISYTLVDLFGQRVTNRSPIDPELADSFFDEQFSVIDLNVVNFIISDLTERG